MDKKKIIIIIFIIMFFSSGLISSTFILDDYEDNNYVNNTGGEFAIFSDKDEDANAETTVSGSITKEIPDHTTGSGYSFKLIYSIKQNLTLGYQYAGFYSVLGTGKFNIKSYQYIRFWIKSKKSGANDLMVKVEDENRTWVQKNISSYATISTNWTEVVIPISDYMADAKGLSFFWRAIDMVSITTGGTNTYYIDDMALDTGKTAVNDVLRNNTILTQIEISDAKVMGYTKITYYLKKTAKTEIKLYNINTGNNIFLNKGSSYETIGGHSITWVGTDENNIIQPNGLYLIKFKVEDQNGIVEEVYRPIALSR